MWCLLHSAITFWLPVSTSCSISGVLFHRGGNNSLTFSDAYGGGCISLKPALVFCLSCTCSNGGGKRSALADLNNIFFHHEFSLFLFNTSRGQHQLASCELWAVSGSAQTWGRFLFLNNWFLLSFSLFFFFWHVFSTFLGGTLHPWE